MTSGPPPGEEAAPTTVPWRAARDLFLDALELEPGEREILMAKVPGPARAEVERMLAADALNDRAVDRWLASDDGAGSDVHEPGGENSSADRLAPGFEVGAYRIERLVGQGGMGEVYLAARSDGRFAQRVAIKVLATDARASRELLRRFERERKVQAQLDHAGIVRMIDGGELNDGRPYLVMEFIDGLRLTDFCDEHRLSVEERIRLLARVCDAVQHAHSRLVIHRDLKPDNILVTQPADGPPAPKLLDFGIAKLLEPEALDVTSHETQLRVRPMTPRYAAPEQFAGEALTTATDVYALGALLCLLTAGASLHGPKTSVAELERKVRGSSPTLLRVFESADRERVARFRSTTPERLRRALDGDLNKVVAKAVHPDPARRYQSAGELGRDLERLLSGEAVEAQDDSAAYRLRVFVRRNRALVSIAGVFGVALVALSSVLAVQSVRAAREAARAEAERQRSSNVVDTMVELFSGADARQGPTGDSISVSRFLAQMERVADTMAGDPGQHVEMLSTLGRIHAGRENSAQALQLLDRAIGAQRGAMDERGGTGTETDRDLLVALEQEAARVLCDVDRGESVERLTALHQRIVRIHGESDPRAHRTAIDLARCLDPNEALAVTDELLPALRADLGIDHPLVLDAEVVRGEKLSWLNRHEEARQLFERVAAELERRHGPDHPEALAVRRLAVGTLPLEQSVGPLRQLIERQKRVFGAESAPVAATLDSLGVTLLRLDQVEECTEILKRSLEIRRSLHGPESRLTANTARNLGMVYGLLGRYTDGLELLAPLAEQHAASERSRLYLEAQAAFLAGRVASAHGGIRTATEERALARSIALLEENLASLETTRGGPNDRYPADVRSFLARLLLARGDVRDAREQALAAVRDMRGADRPRTGPIAQAELAAARAGRALGMPGAADDARRAIEVLAAWGARERLETTLAERELAQR